MAAPNIVNVSSIYGRTVGATLTSTLTTGHLTCATDKVLKINSIVVSNIDVTNSAEVTVSFYDASATTNYALISTVVVPTDSTLVVLAKDSAIYLEEGDEIRAGSTTGSDSQIIISYEELDDA